jgi:hypothetical protein
MYETYNDLVYAIAKRAAQLADLKMPELRGVNGYGCETFYESQQKDKYKNRGQITEEILIEEFLEELDRVFN